MEETTKVIATVKTQASKAISFANSLAVKSDEDYTAAMEEGKRIKTILEGAESRESEITKPLNEALKSTRSLFKPIKDNLSEALFVIRTKMTIFHKEKLEKADIEKKKLADKVDSGYMKPETAMKKAESINEPQKTVASESASATMRTVKKWRVIDKSKIPLNFMEPNMVAIKASFRAGTPVDGVEEYEEQELAIS